MVYGEYATHQRVEIASTRRISREIKVQNGHQGRSGEKWRILLLRRDGWSRDTPRRPGKTRPYAMCRTRVYELAGGGIRERASKGKGKMEVEEAPSTGGEELFRIKKKNAASRRCRGVRSRGGQQAYSSSSVSGRGEIPCQQKPGSSRDRNSTGKKD